VVITMIALSPEWDRWFDEAFTDLITSDTDLLRAEFEAMIDAVRPAPPATADRTPPKITCDAKGGPVPPEYRTG
jgi:hypothetical protein